MATDTLEMPTPKKLSAEEAQAQLTEVLAESQRIIERADAPKVPKPIKASAKQDEGEPYFHMQPDPRMGGWTQEISKKSAKAGTIHVPEAQEHIVQMNTDEYYKERKFLSGFKGPVLPYDQPLFTFYADPSHPAADAPPMTERDAVVAFDRDFARLLAVLPVGDKDNVRWLLGHDAVNHRVGLHAPQWKFGDGGEFATTLRFAHSPENETPVGMAPHAYSAFLDSASPGKTAEADAHYRALGAAAALKIGAYLGLQQALAQQPECQPYLKRTTDTQEEYGLLSLKQQLVTMADSIRTRIANDQAVLGGEKPLTPADFDQLVRTAQAAYEARFTAHFTARHENQAPAR